MLFKTFIVVITALLSLPRVEDILSGRCNAYREFEAAASCGEKGYLMQFGLRNCMIFNTPGVRSRYTAEGREFLECVSKCLIEHLQNVFSKGISNCPELDKSAFDSHVPCFSECGFCKICKSEKFALLSSFDKYDLLSYEVIKAGASEGRYLFIVMENVDLGSSRFGQFIQRPSAKLSNNKKEENREGYNTKDLLLICQSPVVIYQA
ncbi:unnamed protein product [Cylicocyclus nassatus]|uniref:Uncharacterized protein n=1 Tax=Cylicocyclus nassatus TaxID=53992 RepID=A0AA36M225_CYLNA|nr:unnamed protein product [Cylicocyclus nassatus]